MKIGVIGYGVVGRHMGEDILRAKKDLIINDPAYLLSHTKSDINKCDAVFVCVGTPASADGQADISALEEVFSWLKVPIAMIRSTIPPGTTDKLNLCNPAVFIPEFIGEGVNAPYNNMKQPPFLILGGSDANQILAVEILTSLYNSECEFIYTDAVTAETAKYAENYFLALKVSWANELFDICKSVGADFNKMMAAVTHDYRIGRSHTHVVESSRGWGGRCLPKDTMALLNRVGADKAPLLDSLIKINEKHRNG